MQNEYNDHTSDTCLAVQSKYKAYLDSFRIEYYD